MMLMMMKPMMMYPIMIMRWHSYTAAAINWSPSPVSHRSTIGSETKLTQTSLCPAQQKILGSSRLH